MLVCVRRSVSFLFSLPQTIRAVQPDVVVVELCQYRMSMLRMDENTLLKEAKDINLEKVQQAIKQVRFEERNGCREEGITEISSKFNAGIRVREESSVAALKGNPRNGPSPSVTQRTVLSKFVQTCRSPRELILFVWLMISSLCFCQNGLMSGLMQILLLKVSAHITEQLGMAPGGEFREAFKEVKLLESDK